MNYDGRVVVYTRIDSNGVYRDGPLCEEQGFETQAAADDYVGGPPYLCPDVPGRKYRGNMESIPVVGLMTGNRNFAAPKLVDRISFKDDDPEESFEEFFRDVWEDAACDHTPSVLAKLKRECGIPSSDSFDPCGPSLLTAAQHKTVLARVRQKALPQIECYLDDTWNFDDIAVNARRRLGSVNSGSSKGLRNRLLEIASDLEIEFLRQHADVSEIDVYHFWTSLQVYSYVAEFCRNKLWDRRQANEDRVEYARRQFCRALGSYAFEVRSFPPMLEVSNHLGPPATPLRVLLDKKATLGFDRQLIDGSSSGLVIYNTAGQVGTPQILSAEASPLNPRLHGAIVNARCPESIRVPKGTTWDAVKIKIDDTGLTVKADNQTIELTTEEAGFREQDQRLTMLRLFAMKNGHLPSKMADQRQERTPMKKRVSALRTHLRQLLPIAGNPIEYKRGIREYVCKFTVYCAKQVSVRTPAGASWFRVHVAELKDGLRVSVDQSCKIGMKQTERGSGALTDEVATAGVVVTSVYSFAELGLTSNKNSAMRNALLDLLRAGGKLKRRGDDMGVLQLGKWLRERFEIAEEPLRYVDKLQEWRAQFDCSSDRQIAG